jgi:hypothetical protein
MAYGTQITPGTTGTGVGGGFGSLPGIGQIDQTFQNINSMFANPNPSGGTPVAPSGGGPFATSGNLGNPSNINYYSSLQNILGSAVPSLLAGGESLVNTGAGAATGGGLPMLAGAFGMLQPAYDYNAQVLANPALAAAPVITNVENQLNPATTAALQGTARGGMNSVIGAEQAPQLAAQAVNAEQLAQMQAAQNLAGIAGTAGGIGSAYGNLGLGVGGLGTTLTGQAGQIGQNTVADALNKLAFNAQTGALNTFGQITQGIGNLLGPVLGTGGLKTIGIGGCWIAEGLYGTNDIRTHITRAYLSGPFAETWIGAIVMKVYRRFGRAIAWEVRHTPWVRKALQPLFDRALKAGIKWLLRSSQDQRPLPPHPATQKA